MTPMNGAVNSQIRAHTIHEKTQIFCLPAGTNSPVDETSTVCEHVVAALVTIAVNMITATETGSETVCQFEDEKKMIDFWRSMFL